MSAQGSPSGAEERANRFRRRLSALQELLSLYYSPQETDLHGGAHTEVWNPLHVLIGELRVEPSPVLLFRERAEEADKWERDHGGDIFDVSETRWTLSVDSSPERGVEEACSPLYLHQRELCLAGPCVEMGHCMGCQVNWRA